MCQALAHSWATMLAVMQEVALPWRMPQRKVVIVTPTGVRIWTGRSDEISASHSMYPDAGKFARV